ncbi:hypothetical protein CEXT_187321 [Caerostris extrusa]|uniref:Uncharacterized protein n=1 Tax=Caerostris extrusa TaxID=172846 RepID=A0AAV4VRY6_CAEEX|nr:hypothetical protein CEXT_187321 [Caerostris extrusa]
MPSTIWERGIEQFWHGLSYFASCKRGGGGIVNVPLSSSICGRIPDVQWEFCCKWRHGYRILGSPRLIKGLRAGQCSRYLDVCVLQAQCLQLFGKEALSSSCTDCSTLQLVKGVVGWGGGLLMFPCRLPFVDGYRMSSGNFVANGDTVTG